MFLITENLETILTKESNDLTAKLALPYNSVSSFINNLMLFYCVVFDARICKPTKILTIFFSNFNKLTTVFRFKVFLKKERLKMSII